MLKEFKEFALKGNVLDMGVGVIIGAAFGKIVTSLVNDILMPPLGLLIGKLDFGNLFISLSRGRSYTSLAEAKAAGAPTLNYGLFLNNITDFLIVALVIFLLIRQMNRLRRTPPTSPTTRLCSFCQTEVSRKASRCPHCTSQIEPLDR